MSCNHSESVVCGWRQRLALLHLFVTTTTLKNLTEHPRKLRITEREEYFALHEKFMLLDVLQEVGEYDGVSN